MIYFEVVDNWGKYKFIDKYYKRKDKRKDINVGFFIFIENC